MATPRTCTRRGPSGVQAAGARYAPHGHGVQRRLKKLARTPVTPAGPCTAALSPRSYAPRGWLCAGVLTRRWAHTLTGGSPFLCE